MILIISPDVKIIVSALNLVTTLIRMRKRRYVKIGAKTLRSNFGMKATANEMDVATIRMAKRNARSLLIGGKGTR